MSKDSTGTILLLAGVGVAVYGYSQGWFNALLVSLGMPIPAGTINPNGPTIIDTVTGKTLTPAQQAALTAAAQAAAQAGSTPPPSGPPPVPTLGTTVTSANQALQQVAANDAFILPDAATFSTLQSALPAGYGVMQTTDKGGVLLRNDVYAAAQKLIGDRVARASAAGASLNSLQNASNVTLGDIQTMMSTQGLSGLGDYRRHLYSRTGRA